MSQHPEPEPSETVTPGLNTPTLSELFRGFAGIAVMGFGGVLPWARRMLVEQRGWVTPEEFTELLSLCQFLPGGNIINMAIVVGQRMRGLAGAAVSVVGLMAAPMVIVLMLGSLYVRYGELKPVQDALAGVTAAAAGLILAMAAKMAVPLLRRDALPALAFAVVTFVAVAVLQLPLPAVVLVIAPVSVAVAWRKAP